MATGLAFKTNHTSKYNMAYSIDGNDILINGWENGISDNPYKGINDMRGVNIISVPGEASVSFASTINTFASVSGTVTSADPATDILTVTISSGSFESGMAVTFAGGSLPGGVVAGTTYWLQYIDGSRFQLYTELSRTNLVNITSTGTGTWATINMGEVRYFEKSTGVALDTNGRAWDSLSGGGTFWTYMGNPVSGTAGLSNTIGNGLIYYKGYLFIFYNSRICYTPYIIGAMAGGAYVWVNEWNPLTGAVSVGTQVFNSLTGTQTLHEAIIGINDDTVYITDGSFICSLFEKNGVTFNPTNTATYSWSTSALSIPATDTALCLAELGTKLLIGGNYNVVYTWGRITPDYSTMLIGDNQTVHMLTVNTNTYLFSGKRGRIYVTNGSQAQLYAKIPDHVSGGIEPIFTWKNVAYNKNQIYFGIAAKNNSQSTISSYNGLWALDITTNAIRVPTLMSTSAAGVTAIFAYNNTSSGYGLATAWKSGSTYGIDITGSSPYSSYTAYIITDLIPIGQFLTKRTLQNVEFKLAAPLTTSESIQISGRTSLTSSWTVIGENAIVGTIGDTFILPFDQMQWLQLKIEMKSANANSSYVRLTEIRLR